MEIPQFSYYPRKFLMVLAADSKTGATGLLTPVVSLSKSGQTGTLIPAAGVVTELSNGWYQIVLTPVDTEQAGDLAFHITAPGADDTDFTDQIITQAARGAAQRGTTDDSTLTRNALIETALQGVNALEGGQQMSPDQLALGIKLLNMLIREEDEIGNNLWANAPDPASITLQQNVGHYGVVDGLPANVARLLTVKYRAPSGHDWPINILTGQQYQNIPYKSETGEPRNIYLTQNRQLGLREVRVHPIPSKADPGSVVVATDSTNVKCIISHIATELNKPKTGANWRLFWEPGGVGPTTWTLATSYVAASQLRLFYTRPLWDFNQANDDPDIPSSMTRHLLLRLQRDLASYFPLPPEDRLDLDRQISRSRLATYRHVEQEETDDLHNKASYM